MLLVGPTKAMPHEKQFTDEVIEAWKRFWDLSPLTYHFLVSITPNDFIFNHEVAIGLLWLDGKPMLQVFCTDIHFRDTIKIGFQLPAGIFSASKNVKHGFHWPTQLNMEQSGVKFERLIGLALANGTELQLYPFETHNVIGIREKFHASLHLI